MKFKVLEPKEERGRLDPSEPCWLVLDPGDSPVYTLHFHSERLACAFAAMIAENHGWPRISIAKAINCSHYSETETINLTNAGIAERQ